MTGKQMANKNSPVLGNKKNHKGKEMSIVYECIGTEEENQEIIDDVFDFIFEEVMRRRGAGEK
jgi:hypothetical protein